jgi:hypothetical protein
MEGAYVGSVTSNRLLEVAKRQIKTSRRYKFNDETSEDEYILELGCQNLFLMDLNAET